MKREDVSKIIPGITPEQLDSIMNLHGADITAKANEITTFKAADPSAILPDGGMVQFSTSAPGGNRQPANAHEAANAAFRAAFGQKG